MASTGGGAVSTFVERINEEMIKRGALTVSRAQTDALHFFGQTLDWLHGLTGTVLHDLCVQPWKMPVRVRIWFNTSKLNLRHLQEWCAVPQMRRKTYSQADFYPDGDTVEEQVTSFLRWWDGGTA